MKVAPGETIVAVGATDGFRYVGVTPPLDPEEVRDMELLGVIRAGVTIEIIDELEPACSMLRVVSDETLHPDEKTFISQEVAKNIADTLRITRDGRVRHRLEPVWLVGHHSSPFNPDTDSMRRK